MSEQSPNVTYLEAPLVHLIDTDPAKLSPKELQCYLENIRQFRGNPATRKAATEQKERKTSSKSLDLGSLL